jgi:hypothetical protein
LAALLVFVYYVLHLFSAFLFFSFFSYLLLSYGFWRKERGFFSPGDLGTGLGAVSGWVFFPIYLSCTFFSLSPPSSPFLFPVRYFVQDELFLLLPRIERRGRRGESFTIWSVFLISTHYFTFLYSNIWPQRKACKEGVNETALERILASFLSLDGVRGAGYLYFLTYYLLTTTIVLERPPSLPGTEREGELRGGLGNPFENKKNRREKPESKKRLGIVVFSSHSFGIFVLFTCYRFFFFFSHGSYLAGCGINDLITLLTLNVFDEGYGCYVNQLLFIFIKLF